MTRAEIIPARNLEEIANSIKARRSDIAKNIIGIGADLIEAKAQLNHGEFGKWLADNFDMTQQTAGNYMRVAEKFGKMKNVFQFQPAALIEMAKLPAVEVEKFLAASPSVANLPVRQLRKNIKQWKAQNTSQASKRPVNEPIDTTLKIAPAEEVSNLRERIAKLEEALAQATAETANKDARLANLQDTCDFQNKLIDTLIENEVEKTEFTAEMLDTIVTLVETQTAAYEPPQEQAIEEKAFLLTAKDTLIEEVYTMEQAAQILNVKVSAVKDYCKPSRHLLVRAGDNYVSKKSVDAYKSKRDFFISGRVLNDCKLEILRFRGRS